MVGNVHFLTGAAMEGVSLRSFTLQKEKLSAVLHNVFDMGCSRKRRMTPSFVVTVGEQFLIDTALVIGTGVSTTSPHCTAPLYCVHRMESMMSPNNVHQVFCLEAEGSWRDTALLFLTSVLGLVTGIEVVLLWSEERTTSHIGPLGAIARRGERLVSLTSTACACVCACV